MTTPVVTKEYASISLTMDIEGRIIAKISEWKLLSLIHKEKKLLKHRMFFCQRTGVYTKFPCERS